ncbi:hypothetical protein BEN47_02900 [Hymenobacter lapidarius]|uniref:histidine kinase n=1 Tax=Hymenobacter lapidarius TaxID=1908237 RepID=A0A1G1T0D7_9BACT|nr:PAS domain-containing sensor histidine kinase [Hymenobacter lapidarius]OGX84330.1 hypothetical protein BEN47_02900 [Hymenobacter lapidarius]
MLDTPASTLPADLAGPNDFSLTLMEIALTGFVLLRPVYDATGETMTDLAYEYLNPAAQQMLRLPQRPTESFLTRFPNAGPVGIFAFYRDAFLSGQTQREAFNFQHDGLDSYFHLVARRQGALLVVSFLDTLDPLPAAQAREQAARTAETRTALVEAEQQREHLRVQQGLLGQIIGQVPAAIATLSGPEHRYSFFNDHYQRLVAGRAAQGRTVAEMLPEIREQGFLALLDRVYTTGQPFSGTETVLLLPGAAAGSAETRYIDFIYQPLFDGQERPQGILVFIADVTDRVRSRKQAETVQAAMLAVVQRQAQQRQDLFQIFEQTPVSIVLLREPDHRIDHFNPAFVELFPPEAWTGPLRGHTLSEVYPRIRLAGLVELMDMVYATGESQAVIDMPLAKLHPGSPRYVTFAYQAYREEGRIVGVAAFVYDVTDQVLARQQVHALNAELAAINQEMLATNEELKVANNRLTRTNSDLDTFVYSASHDLKSPITNVEGLLLALREHLPATAFEVPLVPRLLGMMDDAVARFQQTLGHLTDVTRLQQGQPGHLAEEIDLPTLVDAVRLDMLPELTAAGATLTVDLAACFTVRFSAKNMRSIVYNLLSNAVKYRTPDRAPEVQLRCHAAPDQVVLEVQDNGLGLSAAQQTELFRMFRRLHGHVPGSGVGLYMVKKMVENAGGSIAVQSQPGVGSTFTVTLPNAG